jgi:hypothetical protein
MRAMRFYVLTPRREKWTLQVYYYVVDGDITDSECVNQIVFYLEHDDASATRLQFKSIGQQVYIGTMVPFWPLAIRFCHCFDASCPSANFTLYIVTGAAAQRLFPLPRILLILPTYL